MKYDWTTVNDHTMEATITLPGMWLPGMLSKGGYRVLRVDAQGLAWGVAEDEQTHQDPWPLAHDDTPDPADGGTGGAILKALGGAVRQARQVNGKWDILFNPGRGEPPARTQQHPTLYGACLEAREALL